MPDGAKNFVFNLLVDSSKGEADLDGFAKFAQVAAAGVAAAWASSKIGDAINSNFDVSEGQARLQAQLGTVPTETARLGAVAGDVWAKGFTGSMEEVNAGIAAVQRNIGDLGGTGADDIGDLTTKALGLSDVFGQDITRVTGAVGKILKNDLAPNADAAFDVITTGLQSNANEADDLLDTFIEYSTQFRQLGLDAPEALGLMNQGLAAGARNADIVADALKEFAIRGQEPVIKNAKDQAAATDQARTAGEALARSQRSEQDAQVALNEARQQAARNLREMREAQEDADLSLRGAELSKARAAEDLAKANADPQASALDRAEAQLAYDRAVDALEDQKRAVKDLAKEKRAADRDGVEGSKVVRDAQAALVDAQNAVRDSAKSASEAQAAAREQLTPLGQAYRTVGVDAQWAQEAIAAGGPEAKEALQAVLDGLRGIDDPAVRSAASVTLFGTKSEDMAKALLSLDPSTATKGLEDVKGASDRAVDALGDGPRTKVEHMQRELQNFATSLINTNGPVGDAATLFMAFGPAALEITSAVGPLLAMTAARGAMTATTATATAANVGFAASMWAATWPVLAVIGGLALLGLGIYELVTHFSEVKAWFSEHWPEMAMILAGPFGIAWKLISDNWDSIKGGATDAKRWVGGEIGDIVDTVQGIPDAAAGAVAWFGDGLMKMVHGLAVGIAFLWNNSVGAIGFSVPDWVPGIGGKGFSIPDIRVPALADGGVALGPTLALVGEGRGPEAIVPLSRASEFGFGAGGGHVTVVVQLDGREIARNQRAVSLEEAF